MEQEPPSGRLEQAIAQIWMETFKLERIDRNADFYELGGDSFIGMDLMEKIALRLGVELPVVMLFQHPTLRQLAQCIDDLRHADGNFDTPLREQQSAEDS